MDYFYYLCSVKTEAKARMETISLSREVKNI